MTQNLGTDNPRRSAIGNDTHGPGDALAATADRSWRRRKSHETWTGKQLLRATEPSDLSIFGSLSKNIWVHKPLHGRAVGHRVRDFCSRPSVTVAHQCTTTRKISSGDGGKAAVCTPHCDIELGTSLPNREPHNKFKKGLSLLATP